MRRLHEESFTFLQHKHELGAQDLAVLTHNAERVRKSRQIKTRNAEDRFDARAGMRDSNRPADGGQYFVCETATDQLTGDSIFSYIFS